MNNAIAHAKYILALAAGEMTDEIRSVFIATVEDGDESALFGEILEVFAKRVLEGAEATSELVSLESEYASLGLSDKLGDFGTYEPIVEEVMNTIGENIGGLERCQKVAAAADGSSDVVKKGVYLSVLRHITAAHLILSDEKLTAKALEIVGDENAIPEGAEAITGLVDLYLSQAFPWD